MLQPSVTEIVAENVRRLALFRGDTYNPVTGLGCFGPRVCVDTPVEDLPQAHVPVAMVDDPRYPTVLADSNAWCRLRCLHDFEYWCITCARIKPKNGYRLEPFRLNRGQRKVLAALEDDRLAGRPIRVIVLKARQWGCSTLIMHYMAWIQLCHRPNWHSLICAQNKDSAVNIRRMYTSLLRDYPLELVDLVGDSEPTRRDLTMRPFEGSINVREVPGRDCRVAVCSSENYDAIRGYDIAMAHLSEAAYWRDTAGHSPDDLIRSVCSSVPLLPYSFVAMESTANGVGDYFHTEWLRAKDGVGDKRPVFVAWYEVDFYSLDLDGDSAEFAASLNDRERWLWSLGCTLEQINWYRSKSRSDRDEQRFRAEFPSDDVEAFGAENHGIFDQADIDRLLAGCYEPQRRCSVVADSIFDSASGALHIWHEPEPSGAYIAAVDVGGRTEAADWSVISVMRRADASTAGRHQIVAQWRGHIDHDILVSIARVIAEYYNHALLIIESNSLDLSASIGANSYVLERLREVYTNLYYRTTDGVSHVGFHTNRASKVMLIDGLIKAVRDGEFVERSADACHELSVYRHLPNGSFAAKPGHHDDILMTRALALYAIDYARSVVDIPPPSSLNRSVRSLY